MEENRRGGEKKEAAQQIVKQNAKNRAEGWKGQRQVRKMDVERKEGCKCALKKKTTKKKDL